MNTLTKKAQLIFTSSVQNIYINQLDKLESVYLLTTKKLLIGYLCMRVPVELIEAYDCVPVRIISRPVTQTDGIQFIRNDACSFCRSVPSILTLEPYNRLSAIIAGQCCDQMRRLMDTLDQTLPISTILYGAPRTWNSDRSYFREEMETAFQRLGEITGTILDLDKLQLLIAQRQQLRPKVISMRESGQLNGKLLHRIAASPLPTENLLNFLNQSHIKDSSSTAIRIMLFGSIPSGKEFDIIEEMGGTVVADATCLGDRAFTPPEQQMGIKGGVSNPMEFLYHYYVEENICPHRRPYTKLIDYVKTMIVQRSIDGVIYRSVKHCHPFGLAANRFKTELNVPFLQLDDDLTLQASSSFRTRIGAFMEMLEMKQTLKNRSSS